MTIRWCVRPNAHIHFRTWGGGTVAYDEESGHTHLLDDLACSILQVFMTTDVPLVADDVVLQLSGLEPPSSRKVFDTTAYLARLDLVERVR